MARFPFLSGAMMKPTWGAATVELPNLKRFARLHKFSQGSERLHVVWPVIRSGCARSFPAGKSPNGLGTKKGIFPFDSLFKQSTKGCNRKQGLLKRKALTHLVPGHNRRGLSEVLCNLASVCDLTHEVDFHRGPLFRIGEWFIS